MVEDIITLNACMLLKCCDSSLLCECVMRMLGLS